MSDKEGKGTKCEARERDIGGRRWGGRRDEMVFSMQIPSADSRLAQEAEVGTFLG